MRKVFGIILSIIGVCLALLGLAMTALQISEWRTWGVDQTELKTVGFILIAFVGLGILLCVLGVRCFRASKKQEEDSMNPYVQRGQETFSQREYQKEKNVVEAVRPDYIPINGSYIWRYRRGQHSGNVFLILTNGGIFGIVLLAFLCIIGMVFVNPWMEEYISHQAAMWVQTGCIMVLTLLIGVGALHIGRKGNSMQLSFARNAEGNLFVFDYRSWAFQDYLKGRVTFSSGLAPVAQSLSVLAIFWNNIQVGKQIDRIDREQVLERILERGKISPYGRRVVSVKNILQKKTYCQIYCSLRNPDGTMDDTCLIVSNTYDHFEELLHQFHKIQLNSAFDRKRTVSKYEKFRPAVRVLDVVLPILCVAVLAGCVTSRVYTERTEFDYQVVQVYVTECSGGAGPFSSNRKPTVMVSYDNEEYQLRNITQGSWYYPVGKVMDVYLADGRLFADEAGAKSTMISSKLYFGFLFGMMFLVTALVIEKAMKKDIVMKSGDWN